MPLYKTITVDQSTKVLIWKIEESYETLAEGITLTPHCTARVSGMKSEMHRRGFMSIRHLLAEANYSDFDLFYDDLGKPHLRDENYISITHSYNFSGIIISDKPVGIDIEKQREKINRISHKFVSETELSFIQNKQLDVTRALTIIWGVKESLYKLYATPGLSFEQHVQVASFDFSSPFVGGKVNYENRTTEFDLVYDEFEGFTCVYVTPF
ncbi:4'-phosphopantetheinyl transferase family protein [Aquimarina spongiae]|uniref:Phosphopantetheinyl transferase n=1 Tax=Aquimarina spongiae TaxID=570521 RepID=A0A1M6IE87_9FLAO|nr:4'-phosphopantetheinyl transferase superfamily protein [Aquimarina spongiae]SHJ32758.1 Phosphopantetheinyl transferase [Aquimarina spongiae]